MVKGKSGLKKDEKNEALAEAYSETIYEAESVAEARTETIY